MASKEFADDIARITQTIDAAQKDIINISEAANPATLYISGPKTKFIKISKKKVGPTTEADLEDMCLPVECDLCGCKFPKSASLRGHLNLKWCPNAPGCRLPPLRNVYPVRSYLSAQNKRKMLYDDQERNVKAKVQSPEKSKRNTNNTSNMNTNRSLLSTTDGRYYIPSRRNQLIDKIVKRRKKKIITVRRYDHTASVHIIVIQNIFGFAIIAIHSSYINSPKIGP